MAFSPSVEDKDLVNTTLCPQCECPTNLHDDEGCKCAKEHRHEACTCPTTLETLLTNTFFRAGLIPV